MFDSLPSNSRDATLTAVRRFFVDYGHELSDAARLLGGTAAEGRVVSCGLRLETGNRVDAHLRRDLVAFHRLLALEDVGDPDRIETELFSAIDPASRQVETICVLTEMIEDLLHMIDADNAANRRGTSGRAKGLAA